MIIRNNLASRPVRNYTLFFLGCTALTVLLIGFSVFNAMNLTEWFFQNRDLNAKIKIQNKKLADLQTRETQYTGQIARIKNEKFSTEAGFMSEAIRQRVFSWSRLLDDFETTLPGTVRMISIQPIVDEKNVRVSMEVAGRNLDDIVKLVENFQQSPAFDSVTLVQEQEDKGELHFRIRLNYVGDKIPVSDVAAESPALGTEADVAMDPPVEDMDDEQEEEE